MKSLAYHIYSKITFNLAGLTTESVSYLPTISIMTKMMRMRLLMLFFGLVILRVDARFAVVTSPTTHHRGGRVCRGLATGAGTGASIDGVVAIIPRGGGPDDDVVGQQQASTTASEPTSPRSSVAVGSVRSNVHRQPANPSASSSSQHQEQTATTNCHVLFLGPSRLHLQPSRSGFD
jgi:hypothetical protein